MMVENEGEASDFTNIYFMEKDDENLPVGKPILKLKLFFSLQSKQKMRKSLFVDFCFFFLFFFLGVKIFFYSISGHYADMHDPVYEAQMQNDYKILDPYDADLDMMEAVDDSVFFYWTLLLFTM